MAFAAEPLKLEIGCSVQIGRSANERDGTRDHFMRRGSNVSCANICAAVLKDSYRLKTPGFSIRILYSSDRRESFTLVTYSTDTEKVFDT